MFLMMPSTKIAQWFRSAEQKGYIMYQSFT